MAVIGYFASLAEAQQLVTDRLLAGIIQEIYEEGQLIPQLPVMQLDAKSLIYNREETLPTADFYDIGEDIPAQAQATMSQETAVLKRCIGQWDLDNFIVDTYRDPNDIRAQAISMARKGVMRHVENIIIYGDVTAKPKEFSGLHKLVASALQIHQGSGTTGAPLSLTNVDTLIDLVKPAPTILLMNFQVYRRLQAVGRGILGQWPVIGTLGRPGEDVAQVFPSYRNIPIVRTDFIVQTEAISGGAYSAKTTGATSSIFAFRTGSIEEGGLSLITGSPMFELEEIVLEDKDANRLRVKWYVTMAIGSTKALARIDGVLDQAVVA